MRISFDSSRAIVMRSALLSNTLKVIWEVMHEGIPPLKPFVMRAWTASNPKKSEHSGANSQIYYAKKLDKRMSVHYNVTNFTETGTKRVVSVFAVIAGSHRQCECGMTDSLNGLFRVLRNAQVSMGERECGPVINPRRMLVRAKWIARSM